MTTTLATPTGSGSTLRKQASAFSAGQLVTSLPDAFRKLDPRLMWRNPVMFVVEVGAALTTALAIATPFLGGTARASSTQTTSSPTSLAVIWSIAVWLWLTTLFANMSEAVAEGRGKAQARSLRESRTSTMTQRVRVYDETGDPGAARAEFDRIASAELTLGDTVVVVAGESIPGDGDIIWGIASVGESAITGESAPVVRESGGDRSAVTGGTRVLSDRIVVRITAKPGETFVDRMIKLVEGASRQKTPNEIALNILLASLTIIFVVVVLIINPISQYSNAAALLLDKAGTITYGNRRAAEFATLTGVDAETLATVAATASLSDPTPEGRSILDLATEHGFSYPTTVDGTVVPFTAQTRMSGVDYADGAQVRKGAGSMISAWVAESSTLGQSDLLGTGEEPFGAAVVEHLRVSTEHQRSEFGLGREAPSGGGRDRCARQA